MQRWRSVIYPFSGNKKEQILKLLFMFLLMNPICRVRRKNFHEEFFEKIYSVCDSMRIDDALARRMLRIGR